MPTWDCACGCACPVRSKGREEAGGEEGNQSGVEKIRLWRESRKVPLWTPQQEPEATTQVGNMQVHLLHGKTRNDARDEDRS